MYTAGTYWKRENSREFEIKQKNVASWNKETKITTNSV